MAHLLGEQGRTSLEDSDNPGAEADLVGPGRAQGQRSKAIRTPGFAGPEVGVTLGLRQFDEVPGIGE